MFRDGDTIKAHFVAADAVGEEDEALDQLREKVDVVYAANFLHLFGWEDQLRVCKRIIKTLRPRKGSRVFGTQPGNVKGQEVPPTPRVGNDPCGELCGRLGLSRRPGLSFMRVEVCSQVCGVRIRG